jgi:hypothetical protein
MLHHSITYRSRIVNIHSRMKFLFAAIILFATIYGASAQTGHICNTYSMALNLTNEDLITTIVNDLVGV